MRRLMIAACLALVSALALAGCGSGASSWKSSESRESNPGAQLFNWSAPAARRSVTPQQAFAAGMTLDLCQPVAARSTAVTWLVTSADFGAVWAVADCQNDTADPRPVQAFFEVRGVPQTAPSCTGWTADDAGFITKPPAGPVPLAVQAQVPAWLSLPADSYVPNATGASSDPRSNIMSWLSATRVYIAGHFDGRAIAPAGAANVTVAGQPGWWVVEHGMATVTVPLADGTSFFLSGATTAGAAQTLAGEMLAHLATELPMPAAAVGADPSPIPC